MVIEILGLSFLAMIIAIEVKHPFDFKPFNCEKCLSFWFGLTYFLYQGCSIPYAILMASITFIVTKVLAKMIYL